MDNATPNAALDKGNPDKVWVDPRTFTLEKSPVIVLCNNAVGFLGWIIKDHSNGNYCHAMIMLNPGKVVTQTNVLKEIPIDVYLVRYMMLKFWRVKNLTPDEYNIIATAIRVNLAKPWWFRMYDYLGLFGQAIWLPFIQTPGLFYCSESIANWLRLNARFIKFVKPESSPVDLDNCFNANSDIMECCGYWWDD